MVVSKETKEVVIVLSIFLIITLIFCSPVIANYNNWGIRDWDQGFFFAGVSEITIKEYNQFPLWNPYYCGGNVMLANPQSVFLSPMFLVILLLGVSLGMKIELILSIFLGMVGMWLISRHYGMKGASSLAPSFILMLSGIFALHYTNGHTALFSYAFLPFAYYFYLRSFKDRKMLVFSSLFLVMMIFGGGVYPFYFSIVLISLHAVIFFIKTRNIEVLKIVGMIMVLAFLVGGIKIIPMIEFVGETSFYADDSQPYEWWMISESLFGRDQRIDSHFISMDNGLVWAWHEYGLYIGILPFILAIAGSIMVFRKRWIYPLMAGIFFWIALGDFFPVPFSLWRLVHFFPLFRNLHAPTRFFVLFIFCLALMAGFALDNIRRLKKKFFWFKGDVLVLLLLVVFTADMLIVNSPVFSDAFTRQPLDLTDSENYSDEFYNIIVDNQFSQMYEILLISKGTLNCYERLVLEREGVIPKFVETENGFAFVEGYPGEAYIYETGEPQEITYFSPNKVIVRNTGEGTLVLNQNYHSGWKVRGGHVFSKEDLVGTSVRKTQKEVTFYYLPSTFIIGIIQSMIGLGIMMLYFRYHLLGKLMTKKGKGEE